jgi:DMSO reductase family type II enzyme chaperone
MCAEVNMRTPSDALLRKEGEGSDIALCRAALYAALALGFRPPTLETLERLTNPDAARALADAARVLDTCSGAGGLAAGAAALARPEADLEHLGAAYRRLFGHTARGEVAAYETEYGDEALFQQPQELGDLAGFMRAFGLALRPEAHERIDHVSCECEFLAFLACKEAYAVDHGDEDMRAVTARATTLFLRDHAGRFAPAFARRLARADAGGLYAALGHLLEALVTADCRRLRVSTGPESLGLRPDPATCAVPMGCDAGAEGGCGGLTGTV